MCTYLPVYSHQFNDFAIYGGEVDYSRTGREANEMYGKLVLKELLRHGSYPFYTGQALGTVIAHDHFDQVAVVRYRSRRDMLEIFENPQEVGLEHKFAGIYETTVVCSSPGLFISDVLIGCILLLILALL